jgi:hypothetical protein
MKKIFMLGIVLSIGIVLLPAETPVEFSTGEPHRTLEFGVDAGAYGANNLLRLSDVFNVRKTLIIDLTNVSVRELFAAAAGEADVFFNLNFRGGYAISVFAGLDGVFYGAASESLMRLLSRGNVDSGSSNGYLDMGGSVFVEAGIKGSGKFGRFRLAVKPAVFVPIIFAPASRTDYSVDIAEDSIKVHGLFDFNVYSAYALGEETNPFPGANNTFPIGFDLSIGGEYALLPKLDIGTSVSHIPIIPAKMSHRMHIESEYTFEETGNIFDSMSAGAINLPDPEFVTSYDNSTTFHAFRPFRFNFYMNYRPADTGLFVIRPSLGFSFLSVYDSAFCFNAGLEGQINILNIFSTALFAGYVEHIWAYDFRFGLNLRVIEILLGVSLRGTDLINAFGTRGLGLSLGLRFGY